MSKAAELAALIANVNKGSSLAAKNLVINGAMKVSQRGTSSTGITASGYRSAPDRFRPSIGTAGTWTISQSTDVPTGYGFSNSYKFDCTTADASLAVGDDMALQYRFEGQDVQTLRKGTSSAVPVTVSFWVKSTKTGTFILELMDNDNAREISKSYTVSSSNTWEYKTVTFEGDTTGALDNDNAKSLTLQWWLAAGTNWTSGTLNTSWADPAQANRVVGQVNMADSTSNDWLLTGVQMEIGEKATEFEHEPFEATLKKCQRYFCRTYTYGVATGTASVLGAVVTQAEVASTAYSGSGTWEYPVEMRAAPTITLYSTQNADTTGKTTADGTDGTGTSYGIGSRSVFLCRNNDSSGVVLNAFLKAHALAAAEL